MKAWQNIVYMSLLVLLPSSSFSIENILLAKHSKKILSQQEIVLGANLGVMPIVKLAQQQQEWGTKQWLFYTTQLARHQADQALQLSVYFKNTDKISANSWLQHAMRLGSSVATYQIALDAYQQKNFNTVASLLKEQQHQHDSLELLVKAYLALGKTSAINDLKTQLISKTPNFYHSLQSFSVFPKVAANGAQYKMEHCLRNLSLIASEYEHLGQLNQFKLRFENHPLSEHLCINEVRYFPNLNSYCPDNHAEQAIVCEEEKLLTQLNHVVDSDYLAVMLAKGKANVHYGVSYFSSESSFNVFIHEISHLLGFVDEYPLTKDHTVCQSIGSRNGLNVVKLPKYIQGSYQQAYEKVMASLPWSHLLKIDSALLTSSKKGWQVNINSELQNSVGIYPAQTCANEDFITVKPLQQPTTLRYLDSPFPKLYQQLLAYHQDKFFMPTWYYNLAYEVYKQGDINAAKHWLEQAAKSESNKKRQAKILQGAW